MPGKNLEIEVKVLLGEKSVVDGLLTRLKNKDPNLELIEKSTQLNHYYLPGDFQKLYELLSNHFQEEEKEYYDEIAYKGKNHSVRSRWINGKVLLVLKAGRTEEEKGANGPNRMEMEVELPVSIVELDEKIQSAGFTPQSKWSRQREEYQYKDMHVCLDKNAGYGYLAEFEKIVPKSDNSDAVRSSILEELNELGLTELDSGRLERMFAYYNAHWLEYYGTDKTFTIE